MGCKSWLNKFQSSTMPLCTPKGRGFWGGGNMCVIGVGGGRMLMFYVEKGQLCQSQSIVQVSVLGKQTNFYTLKSPSTKGQLGTWWMDHVKTLSKQRMATLLCRTSSDVGSWDCLVHWLLQVPVLSSLEPSVLPGLCWILLWLPSTFLAVMIAWSFGTSFQTDTTLAFQTGVTYTTSVENKERV